LWDGVIQGISEKSKLLPPVEDWNISYRNIEGTLMEVEFESHNLALEIIRKNGYIAGFVLIIIYLLGMYHAMGSLHYVNTYGIVLGSMVIGAGISVFLTGQYTLQLNSSFFFMLIIGSIIRGKYVGSSEVRSV
jgi:O-antigen ligase